MIDFCVGVCVHFVFFSHQADSHDFKINFLLVLQVITKRILTWKNVLRLEFSLNFFVVVEMRKERTRDFFTNEKKGVKKAVY